MFSDCRSLHAPPSQNSTKLVVVLYLHSPVLGLVGLSAVVPLGNFKVVFKLSNSNNSGSVIFVVAIIYAVYVPLPVYVNIVSEPSVVTVGLPDVVPE